MKINYNNKTFRVSGENEEATHFKYFQKGNIVWGEYEGGGVTKGTLIAKVDDEGILHMHYNHLNANLEFKLGKCISTPKILEDGKIELFEKYESINTAVVSKGEITLVEV
ncbi:hypothetical protein D1816_13505 [Aquimarina sp. AD10]|uniref:hypothetical protein n=1 Tax=Aquimarina sp. AD10 TaxID=1714849 RepID=UPI000E5432B8|nr:hypothetical protein [Aquimarina sp. AD10]AXT61319.1 hypothetical protein D1816_13505 [Aquimarina sp. AD10]RKN01486.1 hypothetical protein D7033_04470 [Aquimarina sp. AD10]